MLPPVRLLLSVALLLLSAIACTAKNDTAFFDKDKKRCNKTNADYFRVYTPQPGGQYKTVDYYAKTNKIKMTGNYKSMDSAARHGIFVYYDEKGFKTEEGTFEDNHYEGLWKYYYPESKILWRTEMYTKSSAVKLTSYYKSGKVKREESRTGEQSTGKCYDEKGKEIPFTAFLVRARPSYSIPEYLQKNLKYPYKSQQANIEGRVLVKFVVDESGNIIDTDVVESVSDDCDSEALRVVANMPNWIPGTQDDKPTKVYFNLPIRFKLEN